MSSRKGIVVKTKIIKMVGRVVVREVINTKLLKSNFYIITITSTTGKNRNAFLLVL